MPLKDFNPLKEAHVSAESPRRVYNRHPQVTGARTGHGRAVALRLAREGASLSLIGRRLEPLEETAIAAAELGAASGVFSVDIRDRAAVDAAVADAAAARGPLFAVVANAGVGGANLPGPEDRFDELVDTNLKGTYWTLRAAQRSLAEGPAARHMVVIASVLGRFGVPGYTGYCASKTGLFGLVRAMALELAGDNVQVNAVAPGWVNTEMARSGLRGLAEDWGTDYEGALAQAMSQVPLGRMSEPAHVAGLVAWLLSEDGLGVTGQGIDMNNGAWMG